MKIVLINRRGTIQSIRTKSEVQRLKNGRFASIVVAD
jgi:hypothetical protein